jgi:hypothetical protein
MKKFPTAVPGFEPLFFLLKLPHPLLGLGRITAFGIWLVTSDFLTLFMTTLEIFIFKLFSCVTFASCDEWDPLRLK